MALQQSLVRLSRTTGGRVILVVLALYALVVLGDSTVRILGISPYVREYKGEVVAKRESTFGWFVHLASGRTVFGPTDRKTRKPPIGPWRLEVLTRDGSIEVAVPRRVFEAAAPGMKVSCRINPAFAKLGAD